ncbi:membrane protein [Candidatus Pseudothioglobus singularis]|uniref:Membrane protein n=1 Tax=Candidatus Pseudothioglobus singularis PS1 TaxID=1125411 RepID=A0A0M4LP45_9GAMM|nr:membrane protein [Candidatus Pseudothioglobus singularis PS1]ANQ66323.1 membrane protein [Candidatus Pseudothioglobus singularis]
MKRLRNYFISGLLFWIPLALSVLLIKFFLEIVNNLVPTRLLPESLLNLDTTIPGSGIVLVILVILITGALVTNILGRKLLDLWERALNKIPGFRNIYNALKKISSTVLNTSSESFRKAFLIQYPSKGIWVIAFQSGDYKGEVESIIGKDVINLFVPTTPNPTSGFFVMIPKKDAVELQMSVEEAFKLVISAGVVTPDNLKIKEKK